MNKIKVMPGQVWKCIKKYEGFLEGYDCFITDNNIGPRISSDFFEWTFIDRIVNFHEHFEFVPQTDLEWLAVKVNKWDPIHRFLHRLPNGYCFDGIAGNTSHTKQQWQTQRYELGLDEPPINNTVNVYCFHEDFIKTSKWEILANRAIKNMNKIKSNPVYDIYLPVSWVEEKGIELIDDDIVIGTGMITREKFQYITSFAERENSGDQPVTDWVPVIMGFSNGNTLKNNASDHFWDLKNMHGKCNGGYIVKWKPNAEALVTIYLSEQKEKEISDTLDRIAQSDIETPVPNTSYYQDELRKVELFVQENELLLPGETPISCVIRELAEKHGIDIRTNEEKAVAYMGYAYDKRKNMRDVLSEIKKGNVTDVKWVGK